MKAAVFYDTEDQEQRRRIVSQGLFIQLTLALPMTLLLVAGHAVVLRVFYGSAPYAWELLLAVVAIPATMVLQSSRNLLKWTFARGAFITLSLGLSASQMALIVGFVWGGGLEIRGYFLALLIANVLFAILGAYFCRSYWTAAAGLSRVREMLGFGWPCLSLTPVDRGSSGMSAR